MENKTIVKLNKEAEKKSEYLDPILNEMKQVIVGQDKVLEKILVSLMADGHILLEGVPGLAKTLMVQTLAQTIAGSFVRIQFTPDLLPADIIGTKIYNQHNGSFSTRKGPIFANLILADEINRAPPKVQSALLEAMQERQVSIGGETHRLDMPFLVLATQNPVESEGTYSLPEAQVDRFMFKLFVDYPNKEEEIEIMRRMTVNKFPVAKKITNIKKIIDLQQFVKSVYADENIMDYVSDLVLATREPQDYDLNLDGLIEFGASPRASIWMILGGKARAVMNGRGYVIPEDIRDIVYDCMRHRISLTYEAQAEGLTTDNIIEKIVKKVPVP